jgi:hypothetical protein
MPTVGQKRHGSTEIADAYLDDHHHERERNHQQDATFAATGWADVLELAVDGVA